MIIDAITTNIFGLLMGPIQSKETFNFLVVAALQEELNAFYSVDDSFSNRVPVEGGAFKVSCRENGRQLDILTYTPNKMGMPYNAAAITKIIATHQPVYTIFIGTCAGLTDKKRNLGDVLVPFRIFSYESGKYEKGVFQPDYMSYETGETLRKHAEEVNANLKANLKYQVFTDEDFCSGAAVINDPVKRNEILQRSGRKATGLDMEAYSIACINTILRPEGKELIVIKGIMDFAINKDESETSGNKDLAKQNSAHFAFELIKHLHNTYFNGRKGFKISPGIFGR